MYLWHILKQTDDQLLRKVYNAQKLKPTKGDWYEMIQGEKSKYKMKETDEEISKMSKSKFKRIVDKKVNTFAFETLKAKASTHSKSLKILSGIQNISVLKRTEYLRGNTLTRDDCQLLFKLRSKMLDVKANFSNLYENDLICRTCKIPDSIEDEEHLLVCDQLKSEAGDSEVKFDFVFQNLENQVKAVKTYKSILIKREVLLEFQ